jgi:hypothetical protein
VPGRTAILIVNGFDRVGLWGTTFDAADALSYPWIDICLREIQRRSKGSEYQVLVWDNTQMPALREIVRSHGARLLPHDEDIAEGGPAARLVLLHARALNHLLSEVGEAFDYVITLDTDAFPIRDGWIEELKRNLRATSLTGVWRDEMAARLEPFIHPSCLCVRRERLLEMDQPFSFAGVQDVGQRITYEVLDAGQRIMPLPRSNRRNAHFLIGGIYGDLVYHHAAGSRRPVFRLTEGDDRDAHVYAVLRDAVFSDLDHVVAVLRGESDDDLGLDWEPAKPWMRMEWLGRSLREADEADQAEGMGGE